MNLGISASNFSETGPSKTTPTVKNIFTAVEKTPKPSKEDTMASHVLPACQVATANNQVNNGDECNKVVSGSELLKKLESKSPMETRIQRWLRHNEKYQQTAPSDDASTPSAFDSESVKGTEASVNRKKQPSEGSKILKAVVESQLKATEIILNGPNAFGENSLKTEDEKKTEKPSNRLEEFLKRRVIASERSCTGGEDQVKCEQCGKMVSVWDVPEHDDYHFAKQLQREQYLNPSHKAAVDNRHSNSCHNNIKNFFHRNDGADLNVSSASLSNFFPVKQQGHLKRRGNHASPVGSKKIKAIAATEPSFTLDHFIQRKTGLD